MNMQKRRAIAYIAYRLISGEDADSVFEVDTGDLLLFSGTVNPVEVNVYDAERCSFIVGSSSSGEFTLTDLEDGSILSARRRGKSVEGMDLESSTHYEASVDGDSVMVFDGEDGSLSSFTVQ